MMADDLLADALNAIKTNETAGKRECLVRSSKIVRETLKILQFAGYIGDFEFVDNGKGGLFKIRLVGRINECGAIKPRFPVKKDSWNDWEQRYIPGVDFGMLIVSTPEGMMSNRDAQTKKIGGRLIAYVY
ncbi:MAG: 30S ribosomal protein S8 [Candidatus Micrarchaeia archaeon]